MGYAIVRMEKVKGTESFNGRLGHNNRTYVSSNIKKEFTYKNITLVESKYQNYDDFIQQKKDEIKAYNLENGTKNRFLRETLNKKTNQKELGAIGSEFLFTHSPDEMSEEESIIYLHECFNFFKERFPNLEIIDARIHLDETTPHLHIVTSYYDNKRCKFVQKELAQAGLTDINQFRKDWEEYRKQIGGTGATLLTQDGTIVENHQNKANLQIGQQKETIEAYKEMVSDMCKLLDNTFEECDIVPKNYEDGIEQMKNKILKQKEEIETESVFSNLKTQADDLTKMINKNTRKRG